MKKLMIEWLTVGKTEFRVKRSKRCTIAIRAAKDGVCEILAPYRVSDKMLRVAVLPYVEKTEAEAAIVRERNIKKAQFRLKLGDEVRYLGGKAKVEATNLTKAYFAGGIFYIPADKAEDLREPVIRLYKECAGEYISERVKRISEIVGLSPKSVRINSAVSHLGSCSRKGSLNFSWFSVMARPSAIDYIVVHELCHMRYFNHSAGFWREVEKFCPEYKAEKVYLRELWREISVENWF